MPQIYTIYLDNLLFIFFIFNYLRISSLFLCIWAFPIFPKTTYRFRETLFSGKWVGLSAISFALQKEGGQKDAAPIPNAGEIGG